MLAVVVAPAAAAAGVSVEENSRLVLLSAGKLVRPNDDTCLHNMATMTKKGNRLIWSRVELSLLLDD